MTRTAYLFCFNGDVYRVHDYPWGNEWSDGFNVSLSRWNREHEEFEVVSTVDLHGPVGEEPSFDLIQASSLYGADRGIFFVCSVCSRKVVEVEYRDDEPAPFGGYCSEKAHELVAEIQEAMRYGKTHELDEDWEVAPRPKGNPFDDN